MRESNIIPERLLLFDGVCNLCDRSVQFVIRHDPEGKFKFAALQSAYAARIFKYHPKLSKYGSAGPDSNWDSIVFIKNSKAFTRSKAVLKIMSDLGFPWKLAMIFYILPGGVRDALYNFIAKNRYRWYGRKDRCMVPTKELSERFMD